MKLLHPPYGLVKARPLGALGHSVPRPHGQRLLPVSVDGPHQPRRRHELRPGSVADRVVHVDNGVRERDCHRVPPSRTFRSAKYASLSGRPSRGREVAAPADLAAQHPDASTSLTLGTTGEIRLCSPTMLLSKRQLPVSATASSQLAASGHSIKTAFPEAIADMENGPRQPRTSWRRPRVLYQSDPDRDHSGTHGIQVTSAEPKIMDISRNRLNDMNVSS
ncbi:hypothetical protein F4775DRAFT_595054 [Biscogniauxia sp. FL1348]|nr:hypothetical protein F4775DRAFT_595054 [Biscogniauxia sp. FL1348]